MKPPHVLFEHRFISPKPGGGLLPGKQTEPQLPCLAKRRCMEELPKLPEDRLSDKVEYATGMQCLPR